MPWVASGPPGVAARVNDEIYLSVLGIPAPVHAGHTFSVPEGSEPTDPVLVSEVNFTTRRNDDRILSINLDTQLCGPYCEGVTHRFNFDARTGRALLLADLFLPEGLATAERHMLAERKRRYTAEVERIKKVLQGPRAARSEAPEPEDRLAFNEGCLGLESGRSEGRGTTLHIPA